MDSAIQSLPDGSSFGLQFDYSVWSANSTITFANVLWDANYRDLPYFATVNDAVKFVRDKSGPTLTLGRLTYLAQGLPVRVNVPFSEANRYNYLMVQNPAMPLNRDNRATTFFYFIHEVRYVAPNTTELVVQLDVWTTYQYFIKINRAYLERGHAGFHLVERDYHSGREYATVPEGFDLGSEYLIKSISSHIISDVKGGYDVAIVSTIDLESDPGNVDDPKFTAAKGSNAEGLPNGAAIYFCTDDAFKDVMYRLSSAPWVAQGIVSITAIPTSATDFRKMKVVRLLNNDTGVKLYVPQKNDGSLNNNRSDVLRKNFRDSMRRMLPERYRSLSKFLTFPYMAIEVTTYSGTPLIIKPESITGEDFSVTQWVHMVPPSPRIMFTVDTQNMAPSGEHNNYNGWSEHFDVMTGITNLPTFSMVNNSYLAYQAANAHSLAYQHDSADWSQQKALTGAQNGYNMSTAAINAANASTMVGVNAASAQTNLANSTAMDHWRTNSVFGVGTGIAQGGMAGGIAGAVLGGINGAVGAAQNYANTSIDNSSRAQSTAISNNAAVQNMGISTGLSQYNRDTNLQYAKYSAQGDYANAIAGINAKVQDAKMIAPTSVGQVGGEAFNLAVDAWRIEAKFKSINEGAIRRIGEYWLRYGYSVNLPIHMPSDFQCMTNFTYWKLSETYITSAVCPENFKQAIRGIFEKGVTIWNDASRIGRIDYADNERKGSISL